MALRVNLPSAGLLGIAGARDFVFTEANDGYRLQENSIYALDGTDDYTVILPNSPHATEPLVPVSDGARIVLKNISTSGITVTVTRSSIDGVMQTVPIVAGQTSELHWVGAANTWLNTDISSTSQDAISLDTGDARYAQRGNNLSDLGDAGAARTNLGVDPAGTDNSGVTVTSTSVSKDGTTFSQATSGDLGISAFGELLVASVNALEGRGELGIAEGVATDNSYLSLDSRPTILDPAIIDTNGTPSLATGITTTELQSLIDVDAAGTNNSGLPALPSEDITANTHKDYTLTLTDTNGSQDLSFEELNVDLTSQVTGALPVSNINTSELNTAIDTRITTIGDVIEFTSNADFTTRQAAISWQHGDTAIFPNGLDGTSDSVAYLFTGTDEPPGRDVTIADDFTQLSSGASLAGLGITVTATNINTVVNRNLQVGTGATDALAGNTVVGNLIPLSQDGGDVGADDDTAFGNLTSIQIPDDGVGATFFTDGGSEIGLAFPDLDADLTAIAGLANDDGNFIVGNGTTWVAESGATVRTSLGLGSAATSDTGDFVESTELSTYGATLIDDADAAAARTTLGLGSAATSDSTAFQAADVDLTTISNLIHSQDDFLVSNGTAWATQSLPAVKATLSLGSAAESSNESFLQTDTSTNGFTVTVVANGAIPATPDPSTIYFELE